MTSVSTIKEIIAEVARQVGISPATAIATASVETGGSFNPNAIANTPNEYSVGLFQENMKGGEGTGYTVAQLENPILNSQIALSHMAAVQQANPNLNPGQLAAAAQRPAHPNSYANEVNAIYNQITGISSTSTTATATNTSSATSANAVANGSPITTVGKVLAVLDHVLNPRPSEIKIGGILPTGLSTTLVQTAASRILVGAFGAIMVVGSAFIFINSSGNSGSVLDKSLSSYLRFRGQNTQLKVAKVRSDTSQFANATRRATSENTKQIKMSQIDEERRARIYRDKIRRRQEKAGVYSTV